MGAYLIRNLIFKRTPHDFVLLAQRVVTSTWLFIYLLFKNIIIHYREYMVLFAFEKRNESGFPRGRGF